MESIHIALDLADLEETVEAPLLGGADESAPGMPEYLTTVFFCD